MKTLAELRASKPASLPTRVMKVCLDQELLAQIQRLTAEQDDLRVAARVDAAREGSETKAPRRLAAAPDPRLAEIDEEMEALYDRMRETEGELLLRAVDGGVWQRWKDDHPAREDNASDRDVTFSYCNTSDLLDALGMFVASWNGEVLAAGDWDDWFRAQVAPADLRQACTEVVSLHEARVQVPPKRSSASSATRPSESA